MSHLCTISSRWAKYIRVDTFYTESCQKIPEIWTTAITIMTSQQSLHLAHERVVSVIGTLLHLPLTLCDVIDVPRHDVIAPLWRHNRSVAGINHLLPLHPQRRRHELGGVAVETRTVGELGRGGDGRVALRLLGNLGWLLGRLWLLGWAGYQRRWSAEVRVVLGGISLFGELWRKARRWKCRWRHSCENIQLIIFKTINQIICWFDWFKKLS